MSPLSLPFTGLDLPGLDSSLAWGRFWVKPSLVFQGADERLRPDGSFRNASIEGAVRRRWCINSNRRFSGDLGPGVFCLQYIASTCRAAAVAARPKCNCMPLIGARCGVSGSRCPGAAHEVGSNRREA